MPTCSFVTLHLARFDEIRSTAEVDTRCLAGDPVLWAAGADEGAAGSETGSQRALVWIGLGLHADEESARTLIDAGPDAVPCMSDAAETWAAILQPFNHRGEVNWLDAETPGPVFTTGSPPADGEAFAVITSAGWTIDADFDINRAIDFATGVVRVRDSMTSVDGLHSQQTFGFPGLVTIDGITLTFWRNDAAMRAFAYRPGEHKTQLDRFRERNTADRTSFTRLRALHQYGTWHGTDPLAR